MNATGKWRIAKAAACWWLLRPRRDGSGHDPYYCANTWDEVVAVCRDLSRVYQ